MEPDYNSRSVNRLDTSSRTKVHLASYLPISTCRPIAGLILALAIGKSWAQDLKVSSFSAVASLLGVELY